MKNQNQSFLALRHIKRTIEMAGRPDGPDFQFHVYTDMAERLADLIFAFLSLVEWDCVDFICKAAFSAYRSYFREGAPRFHQTLAKWNSLLATSMLYVSPFLFREIMYLLVSSYPHLLPQTTAFLVHSTVTRWIKRSSMSKSLITRITTSAPCAMSCGRGTACTSAARAKPARRATSVPRI